MANPVPGELAGVIGIAKESAAGTWVDSTNWLYPDGDGFSIDLTDVTVTEKDVHSGSRATGRINTPTYLRQHGTLKYTPGGDHGLHLLYGVMGAQSGLSALTADTVKSATPVSTAAGISTVTLTNTGTVTYTQGAFLRLATGTNAEVRQAQTLAANGATSTVITAGQYIINAAAAAATVARQDAQLLFTTNPTGLTQPTLSLELNYGNYSKQIPGWVVNGLDASISAAELVFTATVESTYPVHATLSTPTTPAPTAGEILDLKNPLKRSDNQYVIFANPLQAGGSTAAPAALMPKDITAVNFSFSNTPKEYQTHNPGTLLGRQVPGKQNLTGSYSYISLQDDMNEFIQYLNSLVGQKIPLSFGWANNQSTNSTESMRGIGMYIPQAQIMSAKYVAKVGDANMVTVTWKAEPSGPTSDLCKVFVLSSHGATTL